ncbi:MAG: SagB family peptide dehydrogenase [Gemmatimonadota bacterium]|nr:SagB family peptide dehydrogenase [Gemmatimonadota bacterium]
MPSVTLELAPGIDVEGGATTLHIRASTWSLRLEDFCEDTLRALSQLKAGKSTEAQILERLRCSSTGAPSSVGSWYALLDALQMRGGVACTLCEGAEPLFRWVPARNGPRSFGTGIEGNGVVALSQYALLRPVRGGWILESPFLSSAVEVFDPRVVALLGHLAAPTTQAELPMGDLALSGDAVASAVSVLLGLGVLEGAVERAGQGAARAGWSHADLMFHGSSGIEASPGPRRPDGPSDLVSGTAPVLHPESGEPAVRLPKRDPEGASARATTLYEALEGRASIREYDDESPIRLEELAELFHLCLRVTRMVEADGSAQYAHSHRPYPSGGALYPLEIYPVARMCRGLDEGVYHYDPLLHALRRRDDLRPRMDRALSLASAAMGGGPEPQVLLVIGARPARMFWKYSSIGYALILKEVGAVMQTLYLGAHSMGLAACAIGAGDGLLLPSVSEVGFDPDAVSVGGFCLGSSNS